MLLPKRIYGIHVSVDCGDEETLAEIGHVGCQTPVEEYGSAHPSSRVDRSSLVSTMTMPLTKAPTDWYIRCVGSCTAHLEELTDPADLVQGVGTGVTLQKERRH